jgi:hypothetical protein
MVEVGESVEHRKGAEVGDGVEELGEEGRDSRVMPWGCDKMWSRM